MNTTNAPTIREVDAATAWQWLRDGSATLVDVREPAEHAAERIAGASLQPLSKLQPAAVPQHSGKRLIVHCQGGGRSRQAVGRWLPASQGEVYNLAGGLNAWKQAGLPVERSAHAPRLDVQRQLQLVIGLGVLAGVVLGVWVWPGFLVLAALFGVGMTLAALTGVCPLAMLIARLPWNQRYGQSTMGASCCTPPTSAHKAHTPTAPDDKPGCCGGH